ncbi:hypothetical protein EMPS_05366 [Entomortierella parvispora]|uniref:Uncharacterized protein n=1 Tax=Entomortierella parvispora TaxID=205924 RepID=A0A9P3HAW0_9FUNG|nr:hypothetical protein EMPS_05366 [Entomortierella parvispora]
MCHHTGFSSSLSDFDYQKTFSSTVHRRRFLQGQAQEHRTEGLCSLILSNGASPFALAFEAMPVQSSSSPGMLPLPPVVERMERAGSPLSAFQPSDPYESLTYSSRQLRHSISNNLFGARTHSNIGGAGGGGGGAGGTAPADMSPGGGDATDGDQPSEYTFRRRNAIVEGSDDAPKADDFPNNSPK